MKNKLTKILVLALMMCMIFSVSAMAKGATTVTVTGASADDPVQISTAAELKAFLENSNSSVIYGELTVSIEYDIVSLGSASVTGTKDLDFNNYTVSISENVSSNSYPIKLGKSSNFTMYGGTFIAGKPEWNEDSTYVGSAGVIGYTSYNYATLDVHDMVFYNSYQGYPCIQAYDVTSATVTDCTFYSNYGDAVKSACSYVVINNCTVYQDPNVSYNSNFFATQWESYGTTTLTVNGGTYTGSGYGLYVYSTGGTINVTDGTFIADTVLVASYSSAGSTINIYGGSFDGKFSIASGASLNIYGGTFSNTGLSYDAFSAYVASDYYATELSNGDYIVTDTENVVASIVTEDGTSYYSSLAEAVDDAESGETVTLLTDIVTTSTITITKNITITGADGVMPSIELDSDHSNIFCVDNATVTFSYLTLNVRYCGIIAGNEASDMDCVITVDNCIFNEMPNGTYSTASYGVRGYSDSMGYSLTFTNNVMNGDYSKPIHINLVGENYLYVDNNEILGIDGDGRSITAIVRSGDAVITITNNTFDTISKTISVDKSTATGTWTIVGNSFINVGYAFDMSTANDYNIGYDLTNNFYDYDNDGEGEPMKILDSNEDVDDEVNYYEIATKLNISSYYVTADGTETASRFTIADVQYILQIATGAITEATADVNGDEVTNSLDAYALYSVI